MTIIYCWLSNIFWKFLIKNYGGALHFPKLRTSRLFMGTVLRWNYVGFKFVLVVFWRWTKNIALFKAFSEKEFFARFFENFWITWNLSGNLRNDLFFEISSKSRFHQLVFINTWKCQKWLRDWDFYYLWLIINVEIFRLSTKCSWSKSNFRRKKFPKRDFCKKFWNFLIT